MKLLRFGPAHHEKPGVELPDGSRKDLSQSFRDWDRDFFNNDGLAKLRQQLDNQAQQLPDVPTNARLGPPVPRPGKVICIGLNYADHAAESGLQVPPEPVVFLKAANTVVGPHDDVLIPRKSTKTDWEVELGVIIGKDTRYLDSPQQARHAVAGYCISHDVSEREFQLERAGQWTKGKSCDTFNPLGPYLVTADDIPDPQQLDLSLDVNNQRMQTGNTRTMVFGVDHLVHYLSQFMTLEAGDVITTGTPPGVGLGQKPPRYLQHGDTTTLRIQHLGEQRQRFINA